MTKKTGQQIVGDVMRLLKGTPIVSAVNGGFYREGLRPRDSKKEDIIVIFTNSDADQFQTGSVTINIYVDDIRYGKSGILVCNGKRCEELEVICQQSIDLLKADKSDYRFSLRSAIHTQHDESINQSFIVAQIGFIYFG